MKKLYLTLMFVLACCVFIPAKGMAQEVDVLDGACRGNTHATACQANDSQPSSGNALYGGNGLLTKAAQLIAIVVGIAAVFLILVGGFKYVTASGDPSNIKSAKDTILYAIVGIFIAVSAQSIVVLVLRRL